MPADLERAVMRAVERNPALRQGRLDEFMEELAVRDRVGEILDGKFGGRVPGSQDSGAPGAAGAGQPKPCKCQPRVSERAHSHGGC